jgi:beta-phosphoglucomutase-like phosphatase (HAD superfamily)
MSEAIAAVVFDLDGVLVDSESVWDAARREVVARNGGRWQAGAVCRCCPGAVAAVRRPSANLLARVSTTSRVFGDKRLFRKV